MSMQFSSQYDSNEKAILECWWFHGIQELPTDYKNLSRTTTSGSVFIFAMHRDYVNDYLEKETKKQKIFSNSTEEKNIQNVTYADPIICDFWERPGIKIAISDSISHENISCKAEVINKNHSETLSNIKCFTGYLDGLMEKPGEYKIIVNVPGYSEWKDEIVIGRGDRHVNTVKINLLLDSN